jgi:hypothetical protein
VSVRHLLLVAGAVGVLGLAVYLVLEVSRAPSTAQAEVRPRDPSPQRDKTSASDRAPTRARPAARRPERVANRTSAPAVKVEPLRRAPQITAPNPRPEPKLDAIMDEANKAYDRGDFDEARRIANKVLSKAPTNVRMLRILVSAACIEGDSVEAQKQYLLLPAPDRSDMRRRCERYGISFNEQ